MNIFLFFMGVLVVITFLIRSKFALRMKVRKIIKKHPNTIRYLSKGIFKKHELIKSLKGKVIDELSDKKISIDRKSLDKIIDQEISKVLNGWKGNIRVYIGILGSLICIFFIAMLDLPETASKSKGIEKEVVTDESNVEKLNTLISSAKSHIEKSEFTLAKKDLENVLKLDRSSKEAIQLLDQVEEQINEQKQNEITRKNEEYLTNGITFMDNGQQQKAIKQFEKVSKNSERFGEAQEYIRAIKRTQFMDQCIDISYMELKKAPEDNKGEKIHLFGSVYNIQEISGKTILSLSTANTYGDYVGDEAIILFPTGTPLVEGDFIDVYGEMKGNYSTNQQFISKYLKGSPYSIYYDQRTFFEQAPVLETKVIVDSNGQIYGK